jgi:hypothetical protein
VDRKDGRERLPVNNIGPVTVTTPGDRQIVVTRLFDAPRPLVLLYLLDVYAVHIIAYDKCLRCLHCRC